MTATDYDIAICGGGPVGLALAGMLVRRGVPPARIVVIEGRALEHAIADPRSLALSYGSRQLLEELHAWPIAVTPIHDIHVSRRGHFGRTLIRREEHGLPALGYVTRYGTLMRALTSTMEPTGVAILRPAAVTHWGEETACVSLTLADGRTLRTGLLVAAEGGVYGEQTDKPLRRDYGQTAIVAHVQADAPQSGRAFERFTDEGPLALLPQEDGYALVWCVRAAHADQLQVLSEEGFLAALQQAFGMRVGRFTAVGKRAAFALGLNAGTPAGQRTVAIGNAAQTLHPVAGQGLNLGLRDAAVLARCLSAAPEPVGLPLPLQKFATQRQRDRATTLRLTDMLARLFASAPDGSPSQSLLGLGLGLLDGLQPAKHLLAEQMMFGAR